MSCYVELAIHGECFYSIRLDSLFNIFKLKFNKICLCCWWILLWCLFIFQRCAFLSLFLPLFDQLSKYAAAELGIYKTLIQLFNHELVGICKELDWEEAKTLILLLKTTLYRYICWVDIGIKIKGRICCSTH